MKGKPWKYREPNGCKHKIQRTHIMKPCHGDVPPDIPYYQWRQDDDLCLLGGNRTFIVYKGIGDGKSAYPSSMQVIRIIASEIPEAIAKTTLGLGEIIITTSAPLDFRYGWKDLYFGTIMVATFESEPRYSQDLQVLDKRGTERHMIYIADKRISNRDEF